MAHFSNHQIISHFFFIFFLLPSKQSPTHRCKHSDVSLHLECVHCAVHCAELNRNITDFCRVQLHTPKILLSCCGMRLGDGCHCVYMPLLYGCWVRLKKVQLFSCVFFSRQTAHDILYEQFRAHSGNEPRIVLFARDEQRKEKYLGD